MSQTQKIETPSALGPRKFTDPNRTADGDARASVALEKLDTLWINTGTLCNIECLNCYIESSPSNDRLAYISAAEAAGFFDEIQENNLGTREIAFTGGEPFMNPDMIAMTSDALERGFEVFVLTNAMRPMQRPAHQRSAVGPSGGPWRPAQFARQSRPPHTSAARKRARPRKLAADTRRIGLAELARLPACLWPGVPAGAKRNTKPETLTPA